MEPELTVKEEGKPSWLKRLGLGLVTGTADDRPDGAGKVLAGGRIEDQLAVNAELGQRLFHRRKERHGLNRGLAFAVARRCLVLTA